MSFQVILVFLILFFLEICYFKIADRFNIIDKPNERSSHTVITLRGGGIVFYFSALLFFVLNDFQYPFFFIGLSIITFISFLDDIFTLSNKIRLLMHLISALLMLYQLGLLQQTFWLIPILIIIIIGIINAYNFMDGINGITVVYSLSVLALLAITNIYIISFIDQNLIIYSILGALVFAFFNFRLKAKCFAGDVGSVSMAFIVVFLIAKLIVVSQNPIFILFLLVYGADTIFTIAKRLSKKENIFQAHRSHLYQYLANEARANVLIVSSIYALIQFVIGLLTIWSYTTNSLKIQLQITTAIIVIISLVYFIVKNKIQKKFNL